MMILDFLMWKDFDKDTPKMFKIIAITIVRTRRS